jgi:mono/diheme cytochrome c family protein
MTTGANEGARRFELGGIMHRLCLLVVGAGLAATLVQPAAAQTPTDLRARGEYLVNGPGGCGNCHTPRGPDLFPNPSLYLSGGVKFTSPVFEVYSRNITQDKDTGIGSWSEAQIIRALREGVAKEGNILGDPMPFNVYNQMSDEDAKAIATYLRTVKPLHNEVAEPKRKVQAQPQAAAKGTPAPAKTDKVAYGGYIVNAIGHCFECHTDMVAGKRDFEHQLAAGGFLLELGNARVRSRNITQDKETGIGSWTDAQIKRAITEGINKDGRELLPIMPYSYFKNMSAEDVDAVVAFLRTVPAVSKKIEPNPTREELLKK